MIQQFFIQKVDEGVSDYKLSLEVHKQGFNTNSDEAKRIIQKSKLEPFEEYIRNQLDEKLA